MFRFLLSLAVVTAFLMAYLWKKPLVSNVELTAICVVPLLAGLVTRAVLWPRAKKKPVAAKPYKVTPDEEEAEQQVLHAISAWYLPAGFCAEIVRTRPIDLPDVHRPCGMDEVSWYQGTWHKIMSGGHHWYSARCRALIWADPRYLRTIAHVFHLQSVDDVAEVGRRYGNAGGYWGPMGQVCLEAVARGLVGLSRDYTKGPGFHYRLPAQPEIKVLAVRMEVVPDDNPYASPATC